MDHRAVRPKFWTRIMSFLPSLRVEAMGDPNQDEHRLVLGGTCEDSALNRPLPDEPSWWFPPSSLRKLTVDFILGEIRRGPTKRVAILLPCLIDTPWWKRCQRELTRVLTFESGTKLFTETIQTGDRICNKITVPWIAFTNMK